MSVRTTADECLNNARENIRSAIMSLSRIEVEKVYGYDEWGKDFRKVIKDSFIKLMDISEALD